MVIINFLKLNIDKLKEFNENIIILNDLNPSNFCDAYFSSNYKTVVKLSKKFPASLVFFFNKNKYPKLPVNIIQYTSRKMINTRFFYENLVALLRKNKSAYFHNIFSQFDDAEEFYNIKLLSNKIGFNPDIIGNEFEIDNNFKLDFITNRIYIIKNDDQIIGFVIKKKNKVYYFKSLWHNKSEVINHYLITIIHRIKKIKYFQNKKNIIYSADKQQEILSKYIGDSFFLQSPNGKMIFANESFKEYFYRNHKLEDLNEILIKEENLNRNIKKSNKPFVQKFNKIIQDQNRCFDITYSPIEENGKIIKYCGIIRDVTMQKQLEEALKATNDKLAKVNKVLTSIQNATILGFSKLAEYKDKETSGHLERIQSYVKALSYEIQKREIFIHYETKNNYFTDDYIEELSFSALLHDIGKMGIPDNILHKPGLLTHEELIQMRQHSKIGGDTFKNLSDMVDEITFLTLAKEVAYYHHERWDGKGYPFGLKQEEIPISARIVSICDVYDALTTKRPYKEEYSHEKACEIIYNHAQTHFDPVIITIFSAIEDKFRHIKKSFS